MTTTSDHEPPDAGPDPWHETFAFIESWRRYVEDHPFLREIRCQWVARIVLLAMLPKAERTPGRTGLPLGAVPIIDDSEVPHGHLRLVYSDGGHKDLRLIVSAPEADRALPEIFEIRPWCTDREAQGSHSSRRAVPQDGVVLGQRSSGDGPESLESEA